MLRVQKLCLLQAISLYKLIAYPGKLKGLFSPQTFKVWIPKLNSLFKYNKMCCLSIKNKLIFGFRFFLTRPLLGLQSTHLQVLQWIYTLKVIHNYNTKFTQAKSYLFCSAVVGNVFPDIEVQGFQNKGIGAKTRPTKRKNKISLNCSLQVN